jgi:hypothetical protein
MQPLTLRSSNAHVVGRVDRLLREASSLRTHALLLPGKVRASWSQPLTLRSSNACMSWGGLTGAARGVKLAQLRLRCCCAGKPERAAFPDTQILQRGGRVDRGCPRRPAPAGLRCWEAAEADDSSHTVPPGAHPRRNICDRICAAHP